MREIIKNTGSVYFSSSKWDILNTKINDFKPSTIFILVDANTLKYCLAFMLNKLEIKDNYKVLEIQVDAPDSGQATLWKWTWEQSTLPYARRTITNSNELNVPLYKEGTYVVNNFAAYDIHGSMTQTHSLYLKWIDGAGNDCYDCRYWTLEVISKNGCYDGIYGELNIQNKSTGVVISYANDSLNYLGPLQAGRLTFETYIDGSITGDLTELNCR